MGKFQDRLQSLGFATYAAYLASPHWADFRRRYSESGRSVKCAVCDSTRISLHHHTYARLGNESFDDVVPLCRGHHVAVHEMITASGGKMSFSREAVSRLQGNPARFRASRGKAFGLMMRDRQRARKGKKGRKKFRRKNAMPDGVKRLDLSGVLLRLEGIEMSEKQVATVARMIEIGNVQGLRCVLHDFNIRELRKSAKEARDKRIAEWQRAKEMDEELTARLSRDGE